MTGPLRAIGVAVGLLVAGLAVSVAFGVAFTVPLVLFGLDLTGSASFLTLAAVGQLGFLAVGVAYVRRAAWRWTGRPGPICCGLSVASPPRSRSHSA